MNWQLAIEKNHEALKRILAMLVALAGMTAGADRNRDGGGKTLPRHLHRFVLRLLRPAESATRRLIIIAARNVVVTLAPQRQRKPKLKPEPRTILVLDRVNGSIVSVPMVLPEPPRDAAKPRKPCMSLPLFDPLGRFGVRRRHTRPTVPPRIRSMDDSRDYVPLPATSAPSADDPLDVTTLHRRLDAIGRALNDLPGQATRLARWQARRDARLARDRDPDAQPRATHDGNATQPRRRFQRLGPMRPGRPPGWRMKANHDVYDALNELHGLAVWVREKPNSS